jgi:plastocyanin
MRKTPPFKRRGAALLAALVAVCVIGGYSVAAASADGRTLDGVFCSHAVSGSPFPPGLCIQLTFGGDTVQGYYGSPGRISLRPGDYWLTVTDTSNAHNFSLTGPDGSDMDITPIDNGSTPVITETVKLHLEHGSYTLLCDNDGHSAAGMEITIDVGGVGQVD